jgi:competence ComEA-like helix-hairpin-helix protein
MLNKLSERIGFTQNEIKVIFFLLMVFIVGFIYKSFIQAGNKSPYKKFNYANEDSLFRLSENNTGFLKKDVKLRDTIVDYKQEVLDFNKSNFNKKSPKIVPGEKSINLNTAGIDELSKLPGIGKKTAEKIINYRKQINGFNSLDELLDVKGIGNFKFNKIKKFLFIEKSIK